MYYISERVWRGLMRENFEYRDSVPGLPVITYWIYEQACWKFSEYKQSEEGFAYAIADAIKRYVGIIGEEFPSSYRVRCSDGEMWPCHKRTLEYARYIGHIIKVLGSFDREKSDQEEIRIGFFEKCLLFLVYRLSEDNSGHEPAGMREDRKIVACRKSFSSESQYEKVRRFHRECGKPVPQSNE